MVYYITGNNLFHQWPWDDLFTNEFRALSSEKDELNIFLSKAELVQINWSYNIVKIGHDFYIVGAWNTKEKQLTKIDLPIECSKENTKLLAVGNDVNVILVDKKSNNIWILNMQGERLIKKLNFDIEAPVENSLKKPKIFDNIDKVALNGESCLYLTSRGNVYQGILPSYVDTTHCNGRICDIQCGFEHYVLLTDKGSVYTWGSGRRLQLGHSDVTNLEQPTEVEALAGITITKIKTGGWHTLALSESGDLYAWGWNNTGQLGIKNKKEEPESLPIPSIVDIFDDQENEIIQNVKDIACGSRHSAILLEDNSVWTTGYNKYGQLGLSEENFPSVYYFKKVFQCTTECSLLCGYWTTVIICDDINKQLFF